jgi:hypothetical protein
MMCLSNVLYCVGMPIVASGDEPTTMGQKCLSHDDGFKTMVVMIGFRMTVTCPDPPMIILSVATPASTASLKIGNEMERGRVW